jgi:hypothetical protein
MTITLSNIPAFLIIELVFSPKLLLLNEEGPERDRG